MARITADFTSQILEALRAASLKELGARAPRAAAEKRGAPQKAPARARAPKKSAARKVVPDGNITAAALDFFTERGRKGATPDQLDTHLTGLGFKVKADVVGALVEQGALRDAGFRRSTGVGNKTSPVYVRAV